MPAASRFNEIFELLYCYKNNIIIRLSRYQPTTMAQSKTSAYNIVKGELTGLQQVRGQGVLFIPGCEADGLLAAFLFEPHRIPEPRGRSLVKVGRDNTKAKADIEDLLNLKDTSQLSDINIKHVVNKTSAMNAFIDTPGADVKAGFSKESDYQVELKCTKVEKTIFDDSGAVAINCGNIIKDYAPDYAKMDYTLPFLAKSGNPVASGRSDIIVGFVHSECTADFERMAVRVGKNIDVEAGGGGLAAGAKAFVSSESMDEQSNQGTLRYAAKFAVVRLRRSSNGEVRLKDGPVFINALDDRLLRKMFKDTVPGLLTMADNLQLKREGLRNVWFKSLDTEDDHAGDESGLGGEIIVDENGNQDHVITTPLYFDQQAIEIKYKEAFPGSTNFVVSIPKAECLSMQKQLQDEGKTTFGGLPVTVMSALELVDASKYLPIFFNSTEHASLVDKVPSTVLCYDTGKAGYWCFRPVEGVDHNKKVLTIHDNDWKVLESLVCVREGDTIIQRKLRSVGFHILASGQGEVDAIDGTVVMGRHELIPSGYNGTEVAGTNFELRDGILCEAEEQGDSSTDDEAEPVVDAAAATITTADSFPAGLLNVVTAETPDRKKPRKE